MPCEGVVRRGRRLGAWAMNDVLFGGSRLRWSEEAVSRSRRWCVYNNVVRRRSKALTQHVCQEGV